MRRIGYFSDPVLIDNLGSVVIIRGGRILYYNTGKFTQKPEVSSIMRELAGRSLTGTYLYSLCVKPGISTTSASKRSHY